MNILVNVLIMVAGFLHYMAIMGGLGFWVLICYLVYNNRPLSEEKQKRRCETCRNYNTCVDVMAGVLPARPCAYWEKKKP